MKKLILIVFALLPLFSFAQRSEKLNIYIRSFYMLLDDMPYLPEDCRAYCVSDYVRLNNTCNISVVDNKFIGNQIVENFRNLFFEPIAQKGGSAKTNKLFIASEDEARKKFFFPKIVMDFFSLDGNTLTVAIDMWGNILINYDEFYEPNKEVIDYLEKHLPSTLVYFWGAKEKFSKPHPIKYIEPKTIDRIELF